MIIFSLIITLLTAFLTGCLFIIYFDAKEERLKKGSFCFLVTAIITFIIDVAFLIDSNKRYYEDMKYSLNEYNIKKRVVTIEEDNTIKKDTICFFEKKINKN